MRIKCPCCKGKAAIYSRAPVTGEVSNVYARCMNTDCERYQQSFVSQVSFCHWLDPRTESMQMAFRFMLDQLPPDQRHIMLAELQRQAS